MYFRVTAVIALLSAPFLALAQQPNPFKIAYGAESVTPTVGQPYKLEWTPTTDGTISLILRWGPSDNLADGIPLVCESRSAPT